MLPRTDILLNRVRREADMQDANSLSDRVLTQYLNDAQRTIQNIIFQSDKLNNVFTTYTVLQVNNNTVEYDLPSNVYAENSIISVFKLNNDTNRPTIRYEKAQYGEASVAFSYSVRNRKIIFGYPPDENVLVIYNYRLPTMAKRGAKIAGISGQTITLDGATLDPEFDGSNHEYVSIVDKYGTQIVTDLYIDSLLGITLVVEGDITSATTDHYVIPGKSSSSHSCLPEECENYLRIFTQRKALAHINSTKIRNTSIFSEEEREDIRTLFEDKHSDIEYPVVIDYDYLDY